MNSVIKLLNNKTIFLFDGLGALLSFISTGFILPLINDFLGIPDQVLYTLAAFPFVYMIFSLSCYFVISKIKSWMLLAIILANILYMVVSAVLILKTPTLTFLGQAVLISELVVLSLVIFLEYKIYRENFFKINREPK